MNGLMGITVKALAILKAKRGLISIIISVALVVVAVIAVQRAWNYGNIEKENKALQASLSDATSKLDELAKTQEQLAHSEKEVRLLKESTNALKEQVADLNIEKEDLNNQLEELLNVKQTAPETTCQGLFNTVHRIFKKSTQQKPGAKWLPACSCAAYSSAIIRRTSSRSIRLILSSIVSVLVSLKCAHTR